MKVKNKAKFVVQTTIKLKDKEMEILAAVIDTLDWRTLPDDAREFCETLYENLECYDISGYYDNAKVFSAAESQHAATDPWLAK